MSFATYSEPNRIILACDELPCAASTFLPALLALDRDAPSVSDTALSKALRGNGHLSPEKYKALLDKLTECRELKASAGGIPVAFTNAQVIHGLLMERRRLKCEASSTPEIFSVSINGGYWFVERNPIGQLITTTFPLMAGKMVRETAQRIVSELKKRAHEFVDIHANPSGGSGATFESLMNLPPVEAEVAVGEAEPQ